MRRFITKVDIDALLAQGQTELLWPPEVTITDAAAEYARARGMTIRRVDDADASPAEAPKATSGERAAVRAAVIASLGKVPAGLDDAIDRVIRDL